MSELWQIKVIRRREDESRAVEASGPIPAGVVSGALWWDDGASIVSLKVDSTEVTLAKMAVTAVRKIQDSDV